MKKPGIDIKDKQTYSGAKRVATRRNNDFKRMVEKKLPLFSSELFADFVPDTPEQVIERRIVAREDFREFWKEFNQEEQKRIREIRRQCRELCVDDAEFAQLRRKQMQTFYGRTSKRNRWYVLLTKLQRRSEPISELADMILAWLEQESEPVSHWDLWLTRGDGRDWKEISAALRELEAREMIVACPLKQTIMNDGETKIGASYKLQSKE